MILLRLKIKVINLGNGTDDDDAVNLSQLKRHTVSHGNNYHLQPSFTFYKNFGDKAQLPVQSNINITSHNHHDLFVAIKVGASPGFGSGWAWVSLKMTNNLPSVPIQLSLKSFQLLSIHPII